VIHADINKNQQTLKQRKSNYCIRHSVNYLQFVELLNGNSKS